MRPLATQTNGSTEQVEVNPVANLKESVDSMLEGFFEALPGLGLAIVVFAVFLVVAKLVRGPVERRLAQAKTKSFGKVFASIVYAGILTLGVFFALPLAIPTLNLATMLGGLGLLGVAAGFAFQDILSNMLAGILLLIRDPFRAGDQIEVNGIKGTVQLITIRETRIKSFDGRLVYVPNSDVYSNAIEVQTSEPQVRTSLVVGVDYDADLGLARSTALEVLNGIDDILGDPEPQAYYTEFAASSINLDLRYWTSSRQADIRRVQDTVVERIKDAFDGEGIGIPFGIVTLDANENFERAIVHAFQGRPGGHAASNGDGHKQATASPERLDQLTREQLYELAQDHDVEGRSQMTKRELAAALRERL